MNSDSPGWRFALVAALAAVLSVPAALASSSPAAAAPAGSSATLDILPAEGLPGAMVSAVATGLPEHCTDIGFYWRGQNVVAAPLSNTVGVVRATLRIPDSTESGLVLIEARCDADLEPDKDPITGAGPSAKFTVLDRPPLRPRPLQLSPARGPAKGDPQAAGPTTKRASTVAAQPRPSTSTVTTSPRAPASAITTPARIPRSAPAASSKRPVDPPSAGSGPAAALTPAPSLTRTPSSVTESPTPSSAKPAGFTPIRASWAMPTLDDVSLDPSLLLLVAAMAVLLFILVAFPSDVFNKTYENRREEIHGAIRALGVKRRNRMPSWLQATLLIVVSVGAALLSGKGEGPAAQLPDGNWALNLAAVLIAVPLVMAAYSGPGEIYLWRVRGSASLYVPPIALAVGVACALFSQVCELNPTYAYGLFCTFILFRGTKQANRTSTGARTEPTEAQRAYGVLWSVAGLSVLIALGYIGFSANWENAHAADADWYTVLFDAVAYWVVVLGAESLVFALIPMRFLDGRTVAGWRLLAWMPLQIAAGFFFWYVIQRRGEVNELRPTGDEWLRAMGFFLLFGLAAMTFWGYFQWKGRPTAGFSTQPMAPFTVLFQPVTFAGRLRTEAAELAKTVRRGLVRRSPVARDPEEPGCADRLSEAGRITSRSALTTASSTRSSNHPEG
ncbi:hypothetical protein KZ829_07005 [Actinoplanes hulinensis]|uniref:Uncharacterized protein n=1 Tax=Actinoplanes hulinensis TaxID=1144547 RepID=A0ABS7AYK3_9ACTN|nr:FGLLP motif-containing membrane protein [Actinoplanes hulinensis]MBW6433491.1 hypothetical protein [Actinoplanes hulinensis]